MTEAEFLAAIQQNPFNAALLARLPVLGLPDCWLVSGSLFQTVWNLQCDLAPTHGIKDYDIFYFDPDTSWDAEDAVIARGRDVFADLDVEVEIRNQARVHLWYEKKFGAPYPLLLRATDGIDRFLSPCSQVGVRANDLALYAPKGLDDVAAMVARPNPVPNYDRGRFLEKAQRWQARWPRLPSPSERSAARFVGAVVTVALVDDGDIAIQTYA
jgi:uncharacterized protein